MRAPSTSDVRQRPSTNAELPVDGRDDQLTSGGRAAALSYLLRSRDPLPLAFPRGFDSSSRSWMGARARTVRMRPCNRLLQAVTMAATRGIKDVFIDAEFVR